MAIFYHGKIYTEIIDLGRDMENKFSESKVLGLPYQLR